jgi:catechol 2,3-dioxygenase-like lactoylglutathione lyase family enzyme
MKGVEERYQKLVPELIVSDFERSFKFYTQVIGFQQLYGRAEDGFAFLDRSGAQLMIDQRSATPERDWIAASLEYPFGRGMNLEIDVEDVDALLANCILHKAKIFLDIEEKWYRRDASLLGVRQFIVIDPDGYFLRLSQSIGTR